MGTLFFWFIVGQAPTLGDVHIGGVDIPRPRPAPCAGVPYPPPPLPPEVTIQFRVLSEAPTRICARATNGTDQPLIYGGGSFRLDQWTIRYGWTPWFTPLPEGEHVAFFAVAYSLLPERSTETLLPYFGGTPPPGHYRVCFEYDDWERHTETEQEEACGERFPLGEGM